MRWSTLMTACLVAACANTRASAPSASARSGSAASPDATTVLTMSEQAGATQLTRRACGRPSFGPGWTIDPASPGIACRGRSDCGSDPSVHCIGLSDCVESDADSCKAHSIRTTFCRYDDCTNDADCPAGARCVCPERGGDPWCVVDGCDDDGDCVAGQRCRSDESIAGVGPVQHCSTAADVCDDASDCADPSQACGYDDAVHRWSCRDRINVD